MAINVNNVYQTVLLILNKEQRGYMTPTEFNNIATQVQLEIFEKYFDDLNQQLRVPQADADYADRQENIDEKIAIFKTFGTATYANLGVGLQYFTLPTIDSYGNTVTFYRLGDVLYNGTTVAGRLDRTEFYYADQSGLTKPSKDFPIYLYENNKLFVKPLSITSDITVDYVRKPANVIWGFNTGNLGQYVYNSTEYNANSQPTGSVNFELHESEQSEVVLKILLYAGIVIRDPQIVQAAAAQVQADEINKKS
tara:strand:- start:3238 stop:3993 length:756 start_codon:yes stop_codon:yes gene_type:complete